MVFWVFFLRTVLLVAQSHSVPPALFRRGQRFGDYKGYGREGLEAGGLPFVWWYERYLAQRLGFRLLKRLQRFRRFFREPWRWGRGLVGPFKALKNEVIYDLPLGAKRRCALLQGSICEALGGWIPKRVCPKQAGKRFAFFFWHDFC